MINVSFPITGEKSDYSPNDMRQLSSLQKLNFINYEYIKINAVKYECRF